MYRFIFFSLFNRLQYVFQGRNPSLIEVSAETGVHYKGKYKTLIPGYRFHCRCKSITLKNFLFYETVYEKLFLNYILGVDEPYVSYIEGWLFHVIAPLKPTEYLP